MALKPMNTPVMILDLGKLANKKVKALKRGEGDLMAEIAAYVQQNGGAGDDVLPVVILFEKKKKKKLRSPLLGPYLRM